MDKNVLKNFAVEARTELIKKIEVKALQYGISADTIKGSNITSSDSIIINGKPLSTNEKFQREALIKKITDSNENGEDGYQQVIQEVAYTWFNRFIALRFMEVNNYLPTRTRALSSFTPGSVEPDLIKEATTVDLPLDKEKIYEMKLNSDMEGLFKYVIIAQCNALNQPLPFMFETIGHYTELLFPSGLLSDGALVRTLTDVNLIPEEDWQDVEIIGWLYQYYISEEKDRVIQAKKQYKKDEIPFATQLFTPDWIVRYMVQNSLGRYWLESHPEHNDLKDKWEFYLENPNPEVAFADKLAPYINKDMKVEEITCFDPACGSGHILVYMFDVLYQIYEKCAYAPKEIPRLIIENNLYGLDIDDRAYQLACFAVIMKGMQYNNQLLRSMKREPLQLNIAGIQETNQLDDEAIAYLAGETAGETFEKTNAFVAKFRNAKTYGSLIKVGDFDEEFFTQRLEYIMNNPGNVLQGESRRRILEVLPDLLKQAKLMEKIYDVLVTNPPYMGSKYMNPILTNFIKENYAETKADLFSAFMEYCMKKVKNNGQLGFMTPFVWMFILSYEKLRRFVIDERNISSLIQLEYSAFKEATVPICTFTLRNYYEDISGEYIRLSDFSGSENQPIKTLEAIKNPNVYYRFSANSKQFHAIPGTPISYWASDRMRQVFKDGIPLGEIAAPRVGLQTGDNDRFLRLWHEVAITKVGFGYENEECAERSGQKWFPYNKGGAFRKWYGNNNYVINWEKNGCEAKEYATKLYKNFTRTIKNMSYYFKSSITWSDINSSNFGARYSSQGSLFDVTGSSIFATEFYLEYFIALMCSSLTIKFLAILNPTLHFQVGNIANLPIFIVKNEEIIKKIVEIKSENISISKTDWDSFETSWNFSKHPLVCYVSKENDESIISIQTAINRLNEFFNKAIFQTKENEEELNRIFIDIYGLKDEMKPGVELKDITLTVNPYYRYKKKNKKKTDDEEYMINDEDLSYTKEEMEVFFNRDTIKEFISYAVGCMFGRYSLDQEGLIYAGGEFNPDQYTTLPASVDNIIPIIADKYFTEDIMDKFIQFVIVTFGNEALTENLEFIAEALGGKNNETAKETIRRYFLNEFVKDHTQVYKKRPIYWLFTSGKQKAFNCLVYMHRYDKTTLSRIRTDYLHELQDRLDGERKSLVDVIDGDYNVKEKKDANKRLAILDKQIEELKQYDEVLHHLADKQIEIDLDDGVVVNYEKFKGLLAKI